MLKLVAAECSGSETDMSESTEEIGTVPVSSCGNTKCAVATVGWTVDISFTFLLVRPNLNSPNFRRVYKQNFRPSCLIDMAVQLAWHQCSLRGLIHDMSWAQVHQQCLSHQQGLNIQC